MIRCSYCGREFADSIAVAAHEANYRRKRQSEILANAMRPRQPSGAMRAAFQMARKMSARETERSESGGRSPE